MEFVQWLFGEFIPFGDLVSDVALVLTLPSADDTDDASLDRFMRWLLWVGTLLSSVPEIALFVGIATGLVVGATLGPATLSTAGKGMDKLSANGRATVAILRYILSESKTVAHFILGYTNDVPCEWGNTVTLVVRYTFFVPLLPVTYPLMKLWGKLKPNDATATSGPESWFAPVMLVQVVAGLMTEVASIYFAVSTGNVLSIASAVFGLYCLTVSTLVAILEGPYSRAQGQTSPQEESSPESRKELGLSCCCPFSPSKKVVEAIKNVGGGSLLALLGICIVGGVLSLPFVGVYILETGDWLVGRALVSVGFCCQVPLLGLVIF